MASRPTFCSPARRPEYAGLDQVNLRIPAAVAGAGEVDVELSVAGKSANVVRVAIQ